MSSNAISWKLAIGGVAVVATATYLWVTNFCFSEFGISPRL